MSAGTMPSGPTPAPRSRRSAASIARPGLSIQPTENFPTPTPVGSYLRLASAQQRTATSDPELRSLGERCLLGFGSSGGPPMLNVSYNNNYQIVQTPDNVVLFSEMIHDARVVRMDSPHLPPSMRRWMGDAVGRWDGDTLVIETINMHPQESMRVYYGQSFYISKDAKITERLTRSRIRSCSIASRSMIRASIRKPGGQRWSSTPATRPPTSTPVTKAIIPCQAFSRRPERRPRGETISADRTGNRVSNSRREGGGDKAGEDADA